MSMFTNKRNKEAMDNVERIEAMDKALASDLEQTLAATELPKEIKDHRAEFAKMHLDAMRANVESIDAAVKATTLVIAENQNYLKQLQATLAGYLGAVEAIEESLLQATPSTTASIVVTPLSEQVKTNE